MKSKTHYLALSVHAPLAIRAILEALILDYQCSGVEEKDDGFLACFPEGTHRRDLLSIMQRGQKRVRESGLSGEYDISVQEIPYVDWSVRWKDMFNPVEAGRTLIIMAPWHNKSTERIPVIIEPSMAFGTGEHPTTRLCLEALEQCVGQSHSKSLLDIGTGTGILAIAAAKLGIADITALDSDPVAIEIAHENIKINNTPVVVVSGSPLHAVSGTYDVIVGNLTSDTIKALFHDSMKRLSMGGTCIFSGILEEQKDDMLSFFRAQGIQNIETGERDGWCSMLFMSTPGVDA
jgi:ribosomal protein L11 methyltransferase